MIRAEICLVVEDLASSIFMYKEVSQIPKIIDRIARIYEKIFEIYN